MTAWGSPLLERGFRIAARTAIVFAIVFATVPAGAQTVLLSVDDAEAQANDASDTPSVSQNGRYVAFVSQSTNLVAGDTNVRDDIFVRDRILGTTVRVSVDSAGVQSDRDCENPSISTDGRFVAFDSTATNLVVGDTNGVRDVFLHDRDTDEDGIFDEAGQISTIRVSVDGAGAERARASSVASVSGDGAWVAFQGNKSSGTSDILVYDVGAGVTRILSVDSAFVAGNSDHENPQLSEDGRYLVFESSSDNLVAADTNNEVDVFLVDRDVDENGTMDEVGGILTRRASVDSAGLEANDASRYPHVSDDGRHVVFASTATDLIASDTNNKRDVFLHDFGTGTTVRVSESLGGVEGDGESTWPAISGDGRIVVFQTAATNLVADDTNNRRDVLVFDRDTDADDILDEVGATALYRASVDGNGAQANDDSGDVSRPVISTDGLFAVFNSAATNLVMPDTNGKRDVFGRFTSECGNLILTLDEECDDGNLVDGDGCDSNCTLTACGNGIGTAGEECDDGNAVEGDGCDSNCTLTACGNAITSPGEDCDDGNFIDGDGCDSNCTFTGCGNGIVTAGEPCDEGAENGVGGCCSVACTLIDYDTDGICDVDDLAEIEDATLGKLKVKDTGTDPDRPTGSLVWKGALFVEGQPPYFSTTALLGQAESTGFRAEVFATAAPPTTSDAPVYVLDFEPIDCVFGGPAGARTKAKCKKILPPPHLTVMKFILKATKSSMVMKGSAKRADVTAPLAGPARVVLGLKDFPPLEFEASLTNCQLKGTTKHTLKCVP